MKTKTLLGLALLIFSVGCASTSPSREPQQLEDIGWKQAEKIASRYLGSYEGKTQEGDPCTLEVWDEPLKLSPSSEKAFHTYGVTYKQGYYQPSFSAKSNGGLTGSVFSNTKLVAKIKGDWVDRFFGKGGNAYRHEIDFSNPNQVTVSTEVNGTERDFLFCTLKKVK